MYKIGSRGIKYKIVPRSWRQGVDVRNYVNKKDPTSPMVVDLLMGKTIFAYAADRKEIPFGSLYATASFNGKMLRLYRFDDTEEGIYKGYLMWMEDR
jgi:hypothetical protein